MQRISTGRRLGSRAKTVAAGLVDAGCASLATFIIGFFAVRVFEPAVLGVYSVFIASFFFASVVAYQLTFVPAEVAVLSATPRRRLCVLPQSLRVGMLPCAVIGVLTTLTALLLVAPVAQPAVARAFALTAGVAAFVSPAQDHIRRMMHQAKVSWCAAVMSVTQVIGALGGLAVYSAFGVPRWWVPFSALATANVASGALGYLLSWRIRHPIVLPKLESRRLWWSGRWLAFAGAMNPGTGFLVAAVVVRLAGAEVMGYAEAARNVSQPLLVLAFSMSAVSGPRSMEAGAKRSVQWGRRIGQLYAAILIPVGLAYIALVGFPWSINPVANLLPNAYVVEGLIVAMGAAHILVGTGQPMNAQLVGGRQEVTLARIEAVGNLLRLGTAVTAPLIGPLAVPLGFMTLGVSRWVGYPLALRKLYRRPAPAVALE